MSLHRSVAHAFSGGQALGSGARKGGSPIDDRGLAPLPVIYGEPLPYSGPIAGHTLRQGTPMAAGDGQPCEAPTLRPSASVCLDLPGQSDFGRIDVPTGKDALGSMHWNVDHCPIAMQLKKPAAVDCP
jgi:hypothetical protein